LGAIISSWKLAGDGPPAILFFGTDDPLIEMGREFARESIALGNRVEFYTAEGKKHGFFNQPDYGVGAAPWYELTLWQADTFLTSLGYLEGPPTIKRPEGSAALKKELGK
jgi:acetyl esterase/lipase